MPEKFKSGFVSVIGRTNVGKSSIINRLVGEKVSAVANKTQTTRKNVKAIVNTKNSQVVFVDTPGIHKPKSELSKAMVENSYLTIPDVDVLVYVIDVEQNRIDNITLEKIKESNKPTILIINKIDLISKEQILKIINEYKDLYDFKAIIPVSIRKNINVNDILDEIVKNLPEGKPYYEVDEYTDQTMRELAEEIIREKALIYLKEEVPHGIYVEVTKMKKRKTIEHKDIYDIDSTIFCLKKSHKGIIIGKQGSMLKKIGTSARIELEKMFGSKINLSIIVKVDEDWINNKSKIKKMLNTN